MTKRYVLDTAGLNLTPDDFVTPASQVQAFVGGRLLRKLAGVASDAGIAAYVSPDPWTFTFDFTVDDYDWTVVSPAGSVYTPGVGFEDGLNIVSTYYYRNIVIKRTINAACTLTDVTVNYSMTTGTLDGGTGDVNSIARYTTIYNHLYSNLVPDPTPNPMVWSGTQAFNPTDELRIALTPGLKNGSEPGGTGIITSIEISGTGVNPFGEGIIISSTDSGSTIDTIEVAGSGYPATAPAFDACDYAGVEAIIVTAGSTIHYINAFDAANSAEIAGLDGVNGTALITAIRVPYLKLATQAANSSASSLQFIYCTNSAVGGETIFAANVNVSTGAIVGVESTLTPIISATTYYVIGANAIEFFGGNSQVALALCKPVGGGSTVLLATDDGGTTWENKATIDGTSVSFIPPDKGGTGQQAFICGSAIGVRFTSNRGTTIVNVSGDINSETSSAAAIKAIAI